MKPQEANKLIAEFMGGYIDAPRYHLSWDALMPVITELKNIDRDWIDQGGQKFIDEIDNGLTCWGGILDVHHDVVLAIMNYNEYKS